MALCDLFYYTGKRWVLHMCQSHLMFLELLHGLTAMLKSYRISWLSGSHEELAKGIRVMNVRERKYVKENSPPSPSHSLPSQQQDFSS